MIVRIARRENPFVQIDKRPLEDSRLSWRAKGILAYLLSKPDKWEVQTEDVISHGTEGRDAVRAAMSELREAGYAELETIKEEGGRMSGRQWVVFEECRKPENPSVGKTESLKTRLPENPSLSNKEGSKNEGRENDFSLSPDIGKTKRKGSGQATQEEVEAFAVETGQPKSDGTAMFWHFTEKGWGKNWQATVRKWKEFGYLPSQKTRNGKPVEADKFKRHL